MDRRRLSVTVSVSAALLIGALALASCGGGGSKDAQTTTNPTTEQTTTQPAQATVMRIVVADGSPKGGIVRVSVQKGDRVVVLVTSDVSDEVHVHGYDLMRDVAPGERARIAFVAKLPGRFEIELEQKGLQIGDLTVES